MVFKIFIFLLLLLGMNTGCGQQKKWTLQDCIDYGVEQSLQMQKLQNDNNRLEVRDPVMKLCPKLSFRCLPFSLSVFLKVYERIDFQTIDFVSYLSALGYIFFNKKM